MHMLWYPSIFIPRYTMKTVYILLHDVRDNLKKKKETGMRERGGVTRRTRAHCSEDKASLHGTPALPTELNDVLSQYIFTLFSSSILYVKLSLPHTAGTD